MIDTLDLFGFNTSNNMKIRVALGFKGIAYQWHEIDPADRTAIEQLSGQPLTPVIRHGATVLFDSGAILRYLEANFRDAPPLFSRDYAIMRQIEEWESFGRTALLAPLLSVVMMRREGGDDATLTARAATDLAGAVQRLEEELSQREWLLLDRLTAADVTTAPVLHRVRSSGILPLPEGVERVIGWVDRVMEYDRGGAA